MPPAFPCPLGALYFTSPHSLASFAVVFSATEMAEGSSAVAHSPVQSRSGGGFALRPAAARCFGESTPSACAIEISPRPAAPSQAGHAVSPSSATVTRCVSSVARPTTLNKLSASLCSFKPDGTEPPRCSFADATRARSAEVGDNPKAWSFPRTGGARESC